MDKLQKWGREFGWEGKELQDFVAQKSKREKDERPAEIDIEKAKIAQQHEIELVKVEAEKAKVVVEEAESAHQRKIELAKVEGEKAKVAVDEAKLTQQ